jgi:tRNA threonylcarbamoyladenosine biosynthesis protein TsaB
MKILALDTATEACSAALLIDGRLAAAREMEFERGHAEHILPMIDAVLAEGGVPLAAVDAVAFGRGPGGFTGVRLAASVTQGLAFAADRPVVPISDLAAVAQRAFDAEPGIDRVVVCNDARMQEVYWGCFERDGQGLAALVGAEHVSPPQMVELWPEWQAAKAEASTTSATSATLPSAGRLEGARAALIGAVGRGFRAYPALRSKLLSPGAPAQPDPAGQGLPVEQAQQVEQLPIVRLISDALLPRAHEIARLAAREIQAGRLVPADQAIPVYLRDDVARPPSPSQN